VFAKGKPCFPLSFASAPSSSGRIEIGGILEARLHRCFPFFFLDPPHLVSQNHGSRTSRQLQPSTAVPPPFFFSPCTREHPRHQKKQRCGLPRFRPSEEPPGRALPSSFPPPFFFSFFSFFHSFLVRLSNEFGKLVPWLRNIRPFFFPSFFFPPVPSRRSWDLDSFLSSVSISFTEISANLQFFHFHFLPPPSPSLLFYPEFFFLELRNKLFKVWFFVRAFFFSFSLFFFFHLRNTQWIGKLVSWVC